MNHSGTAVGGRPVAYGSGPRATATYDGGTGSIAVARALAADFLDEAHDRHGVAVPPQVRDDAQLLVSELVTNASKYAPGPCVLDLEIRGTVLEIACWDSDTVLPTPGAAGPGRIGRHGLEIVFALCEGFDVRREPVGKRVTVRLALVPTAPLGA